MRIPSTAKENKRIVINGDTGQRIDYYLSKMMDKYSRSYFKRRIQSGDVLVNGKPVKPTYRPKKGDTVSVFFPEPETPVLTPEDIPVDIVYQDDCLAVINKAAGMVVHPAPGHYSSTLVNALLFHLKDLSGINGTLRPGIVHRLDKDTTGLMVVAKNDRAYTSLSGQIRRKAAHRVYWALAYGNMKEDAFTVERSIARHRTDRKKMAPVLAGGRRAVTHFKVLERFGEYTLVEAALETGRTHQIRVHLKHRGNPVCGDPVYGRRKEKFNINRQLLHAKKLGFIHPETGKEMWFEAPLPEDFKRILDSLRINCG